jgi:hypothetical protein
VLQGPRQADGAHGRSGPRGPALRVHQRLGPRLVEQMPPVDCTCAWVVPRPWRWRWRLLARRSRAPRRLSRTGCRLVADLGRGPLPLRLLRSRLLLDSLTGRLAAVTSDALARAP